MNRFFSSIFIACLPVALSLSGTAQAQMVPEGGGMKQELADKGYNFRLYGKFRPKVSFIDDGNDSSTDVRDDSSRLGIQGKIPINNRLTGVLRGEWRVEIGEDQDQDGRGAGGSLGNARLAYAGLESKDAGFLGIGQQWNPYYDIAVVPVDILYNVSENPIGYNQVGGPFRNSNMVKYAHSVGAFNVSAGVQVDGRGSRAGAADNVDALALGAGLELGRGYIGVAYWQQNMDGADRGFQSSFFNGTNVANVGDTINMGPAGTVAPRFARTRVGDANSLRNVNVRPGMAGSVATAEDAVPETQTEAARDALPAYNDTGIVNGTVGADDRQTRFIGIGAGFNVTEDLYVGALYQDVSIENDAQSCATIGGTSYCVDNPDIDPSSFDLAATYSFGNGMKLLAAVSTYDNDTDDTAKGKGVTFGLAKNLASGLDVYIDWLRDDPDEGDASNVVNIGVRYNFDVGLL